MGILLPLGVVSWHMLNSNRYSGPNGVMQETLSFYFHSKYSVKEAQVRKRRRRRGGRGAEGRGNGAGAQRERSAGAGGWGCKLAGRGGLGAQVGTRAVPAVAVAYAATRTRVKETKREVVCVCVSSSAAPRSLWCASPRRWCAPWSSSRCPHQANRATVSADRHADGAGRGGGAAVLWWRLRAVGPPAAAARGWPETGLGSGGVTKDRERYMGLGVWVSMLSMLYASGGAVG